MSENMKNVNEEVENDASKLQFEDSESEEFTPKALKKTTETKETKPKPATTIKMTETEELLRKMNQYVEEQKKKMNNPE